MEELKTEGVVLSHRSVGERDAFITILTADAGCVNASARGIKNMKSKLRAGCSLFSYSSFSLTETKGAYIVTSAVQQEGFFGLSSNIERLSYGAYLAELTAKSVLSPEDAKEVMPVLLNALYLLSNTDKPMRQTKCVFELKLLCALGMMPELSECVLCGETENLLLFDPQEGGTVCPNCGGRQALLLPAEAKQAMEYAVSQKPSRAFAFSLSDAALKAFDSATEAMCIEVIGSRPKTLDYLYRIMGNPQPTERL